MIFSVNAFKQNSTNPLISHIEYQPSMYST